MSDAGADDPLLDVTDLRVQFESFRGVAEVIDGVDISVDPGEVVAIVGETGCGKSVTMKAILGLLNEPPAEVNVERLALGGTDILDLSPDEREDVRNRRASVVFQNPMSSLNPVYTVGEQLIDTAQFGGADKPGPIEYVRRKHAGNGRERARERVLELLEEVQLPDPESVLDTHPTQLSGGMQQRVLIAQTLLNDPELIVADEMGTALDVTIHDQILELVEDLIAERDLGLLMITHNLGVARRLSDRTYVMYGGNIVEHAPTEELFEHPRHPYTQGLLASIPSLTGSEMHGGIDGTVPEYEDPPSGCRFHPRCPYATDRCREEKPGGHDVGRTDVACHLYDPRTHDESQWPTLSGTAERLDDSHGDQI